MLLRGLRCWCAGLPFGFLGGRRRVDLAHFQTIAIQQAAHFQFQVRAALGGLFQQLEGFLVVRVLIERFGQDVDCFVDVVLITRNLNANSCAPQQAAYCRRRR